MTVPPAADATTRRLWTFAKDLEQSLGDAAQVEHDDAEWYSGCIIRPSRGDALGIQWVEFGSEVVLATTGGLGGRWELGRTDADMEFLENVVHSVIAGRVVEVSAVDRSRVEVTLPDGTVAVEVGSSGCRSLLPKPGWQRRGRRTEYAPYEG